MAVNQTPAFNFDWKIIYGQMGLAGNGGQAGTNVPHHRVELLLVYHCGLLVSAFVKIKIKGAKFKK